MVAYRWPALIISSFALSVMIGCGTSSTVEPDEGWSGKPGPKVLASFSPIQCFAMNVAGEHATVRGVMSNQGPHHFDAGPSHARMLAGADIFFINGLSLDNSVAKKMSQNLGKKKLSPISLGSAIPDEMLIEGSCSCCDDHGTPEEATAHEAHGDHDPHVWLGIDQANKMVEKIRDELKAADPNHAADYDRRATEYSAKLNKLKADGLAMLKAKTERQFVSFHGSLAYFAKTFDLKDPEVIQQVAGSEPSPKELDTLVKRCVSKKIRVIAVEPQYNATTSAKSVLDELKRRGVADPVFVVIDPLEISTDAEFGPEWYEKKMRENLEALAKVLK